MPGYCTNCGAELKNNAKFCTSCGRQVGQASGPVATQTYQQTQAIQQQQRIKTSPTSNISYQNFYRIRKKVMALTNKYWIEDYNGNIMGFCKQKMFKLKEDIRIYADESLSQELFSIKQQQIMDAWGSFAVVDSTTGVILGSIRREWLSSAFTKDTWEIFNENNQLIGKITETSTGEALARKYLPGGGLIPERMTLDLNGVPIAEINQSFKIIGDIWEINCHQVPSNFDRRVLLGTMILMGTIERSRK